MMKTEKYKEEIYKCSGCGLCQYVCPVYKILKMESAVSRGKFKLLNAILNKDIKFSRKTLEIINLCLHCQACSEFCPSNIDAQKILETAQYDMLNCGIFSWKKALISWVFEHKFLLKFIKLNINLIRKIKLPEIFNIHIEKINFINRILNINIPYSENNFNDTKKCKILYFKGCINNYINPSCENAVKNILNSTDTELLEADFECCGLPLKSSGDFEAFKNIAQKNIELIDENIDYVVFDCASCLSTFLEYDNFIDSTFKEKFAKIKSKLISIYELLEKIDYIPQAKSSKTSVTIHYPCHTRQTKEKEIIKNIIKKIPNTEIKEMNEANTCCGAAGSFLITNSKISKQISKVKAENIINTKADVVLTTCPSCVMGLTQGLIEKKSNIKVMQLIEFLALK